MAAASKDITVFFSWDYLVKTGKKLEVLFSHLGKYKVLPIVEEGVRAIGKLSSI